MSTLPLLLVLLAALLHAGWNLIAKRAAGGDALVLLSSIFVSIFWAPVALWAWLHDPAPWPMAAWIAVVASAFLHVTYFRVLLHGYAVSDLSVVYPLARGSGPLLSTAGAILLLDESLSPAGMVGVALVIAGVFLIAGGPALWRQASDPVQHRRVRLGLFWGLATGLFIAAYTVVDGYAVKVLLVSPILLDYLCNVLRIPVMLPVAWRQRETLRHALRAQWRPALAVAVMAPLSYTLVLFAMRMAPLSHVAPAREVSMLFAAIAGGTLLGESDRWLRLAGAAAIASGVAALALA